MPKSPRDLTCVVTHDGLKVKALINRWHSTHRAPAGWRVAFLLLDGSQILGVSTFGRPVARLEDQKQSLEHTRMALDRTPKNTGSWFLAQSRQWIRENMPEITRLIAYVDLTIHHGTIYRADNWKLISSRKTWNTWKNREGRQGKCAKIRAKFERNP